jgi:protein-tyrosine phosphatase
VIDIHSHVLWGIDDGATAIEESLEMLDAAAAGGTTDIVATPHCNQQYDYDPGLVASRIAELREKAVGQVKIHRGCEFHLTFDNLDNLLRQPTAYTINGTRYLLLECPDGHVGRHTESVFERLMDAGIVPIVAHPERNPQLQRGLDRVAAWVELGCLMQVTSLSITGDFGNPPKSAAARLLDRGLAHVVASDAHDPSRRHPRLTASYNAVRQMLGGEAAELLFRENPRAVIDGAAIPSGRLAVAAKPRRWWQFGGRC